MRISATFEVWNRQYVHDTSTIGELNPNLKPTYPRTKQPLKFASAIVHEALEAYAEAIPPVIP
jgi:hypothetical protein